MVRVTRESMKQVVLVCEIQTDRERERKGREKKRKNRTTERG